MKVVINRKFGGFGLSPTGMRAYAKRKGFELFFYQQTKYECSDGVAEYRRMEDPPNSLFIHAVRQDLGETVIGSLYDTTGSNMFAAHDLDRTDSDLIAVVEELGDDASGQCAELVVVEIPDGVQFQIEDYDGLEHIAETHRTWS